jgi:hypothetical protein
MSSIVISGDTSGAITLSAPAVAGTNTVTLPAAAGTVQVSGNMPAFSAYQSSTQTVTNAVNTKVQFQTAEYDTSSPVAYDTTNNRFLPKVAGYYQVTASVYWNQAMANETTTFIYKNGSLYKGLADVMNQSGTPLIYQIAGTCMVYLNGSTDYIEVYCIQNTGVSKNIYASAVYTYFQASMVRSA